LEINFPGYDFSKDEATTTNKKDAVANPREQDPLLAVNNNNTNVNVNDTVNKNKTPVWMYFFLAIPAIFDLAATALCMMGLRYLDVSIYQLLRGSGIVFVALMKQYVLKDHLYTYQWVGVVYNVVSVFLVGGTAVLNELDGSVGGIDGDVSTKDPGLAFLGVLLVMCGAFVQALQFVFEEKVMTMDEAAVPPLLLIGMEGLWGTFLCLVVVYPMAYFIPGGDHGSYEDPWNTWHMFVNTPIIQTSFVLYFGAIFGYNLFAVLVTFSLNSIWHAILVRDDDGTASKDNFWKFIVGTKRFSLPFYYYLCIIPLLRHRTISGPSPFGSRIWPFSTLSLLEYTEKCSPSGPGFNCWECLFCCTARLFTMHR